MTVAPMSVMVTGLLACSVLGQALYDPTPDWVSTDTPVSTGGALVDLDNDGWLDFVVANGNDILQQQVAVYYNQGDGTFPAAPGWQSDDIAYNGHLDVADVNGDGWMDVAVSHLGEHTTFEPIARLYLNNSGTLSSLPDWAADIDGNAFGVAFGDVNNDGRPDLAVATGWSYSPQHFYPTYVYLNVGGALEPTASWVSDDTSHYLGVLWVDADSDGWLDLVGLGSLYDTQIYRNLGGVLETTASWRTTDTANQDAIMGSAGDVNGDGLRDLLLTDNTQIGGSGRFRQYDGLPGGDFSTTYGWSYFEGYGSALALADVNADGYLDLATGGWWENARVFLNSGSGLPAAPDWSSGVTSVVEKIVLGDVDNDGLRYPVDSFDVTATPGRRLFYLTRQPIDRLEYVEMDGVPLTPDQFTFDAEHGWVSVGLNPTESVTVGYVYTLKPDMGITNWGSSESNYLYYNLNDAMPFGDFYGDADVDAEDFGLFDSCFTGPGGGPVDQPCSPGDADLDGDIDCDDWVRFEEAWTEPEPPPPLWECSAECGNGVVEPGELCDTGIAPGEEGACPTDCDSGDPCISDTLLHPGTCQAECEFEPITFPVDDDGCCPPGANAVSDNDCSPVCGNGVCEEGEEVGCIPDCECADDSECDDNFVCTFDQCLGDRCSYTPNTYGDVDRNTAVNVFDLFCILNGFGGDFSVCSFEDDDVHPCAGDGTINIFDLFAVLNAFGGVDPCCGGLR